jgi:hypothetical protein
MSSFNRDGFHTYHRIRPFDQCLGYFECLGNAFILLSIGLSREEEAAAAYRPSPELD